jgi:hypothetical protein
MTPSGIETATFRFVAQHLNHCAVLLYKRNKFPSVPLAHVANMKQSYENMKLLFEKIQYEKYN